MTEKIRKVSQDIIKGRIAPLASCKLSLSTPSSPRIFSQSSRPTSSQTWVKHGSKTVANSPRDWPYISALDPNLLKHIQEDIINYEKALSKLHNDELR